VPVLSAAERHQILATWNDTAQPGLAPTLPELFQAQATRTPDAVALVSHGVSITYAELDAAAIRRARQLRAAGAGPETVVGLLLPTGSELIIAVLAVLKTGAA